MVGHWIEFGLYGVYGALRLEPAYTYRPHDLQRFSRVGRFLSHQDVAVSLSQSVICFQFQTNGIRISFGNKKRLVMCKHSEAFCSSHDLFLGSAARLSRASS